MYDLQMTFNHLCVKLPKLIFWQTCLPFSLEIFIECFVRDYIITLFITVGGHVPNHHDRRMLFGANK